ncbi:hypothetical protein [Staphylococcus aureus]|uniref:hypothetical protein n=1 Tax=Staphylococcus aureus TaxID=1280 RepID=UPI00388ECE8A
MSPMVGPVIGPDIVPSISSMIKDAQKVNIRTVIAPEHKKKQKNIENELKGEEKVLIEQMAKHCEAFKANFKGAAQGDWVKSAMSEIDSIKDDLKKINS